MFDIQPISQAIKEQLQRKIDFKTKPIGALGKLEKIALQIGSIQQSLEPELIEPALFVFAADNGIVESGVSPFPKEVTMQMVMNFVNGGAAINVFCKQNKISLKIVDAGVDAVFAENEVIIDAKVGMGTANILLQPAMTRFQCIEALKKGGEIIDHYTPVACNVVGFGEMGIGNTSTSALLMSRFCSIPVAQCVGRGTGLDDEGLQKKTSLLHEALMKYPHNEDPLDTLATFGGFDIAMMAGAMLRAAEKKMVILLDGFIATAALLTASKFDKNVTEYCISCHQSGEHGHKLMLDYLQLEPLLDLNMRLGEGTGAAVAYPLVQSAVNFLNQMASFESAGVANRE